jgi:hypothetical protein
MSRLRIRKPSPAMVVAVVALMVSLGGTSYAAFGPFNGDQLIVSHSLSGNRLQDHSVGASQIRVRDLPTVPSAVRADLANSATSATNANSATSATNATNATNATMAATANSLSGVTIVVGQNTTAPPGSKTGETADCPPGMVAIGGGVRSAGSQLYINNIRIASNPVGTPNTEVRASVTNGGSVDDSYHVQAVCIHGQVTGGER